MKFQKLKGLAAVMVMGIIFSGCGNKETPKTAQKETSQEEVSSGSDVEKKSKVAIKANLKEGYYVKINDSLNTVKKNSRDFFVLAVELQNTSSQTESFQNTDFSLISKKTGDVYETDTPGTGFDQENLIRYETLKKNEKLEGILYFDIPEDEMYELAFRQEGSDEWTSLKVKVDPSQYVETKEALSDPLKATAAYLNVMAFNEEDPTYETFVQNDLETSKNFHQNLFKKNALDSLLSRYKPTPEVITSIYNRFQAVQKERATISSTLISNDREKAVVSMDVEEMSYRNIKELFHQYTTEQYQATSWSGITNGKGEEDTLPKLEEIMGKSVLVKREEPIEIELTKREGKWEFDLNDDVFNNIFYGGFTK